VTVPTHIELNYTEYGMKLYNWAFANQIPISGGMELTHRCNLRCVHCYVASDRYPKELTTEEWFQIINQIADAGCFWFYITGGEPMIRPDFLPIYLHSVKRGMTVAVLSNATRISEEIADTLAEYPPQVVEISMYGATQETFERVGKIPSGYRKFMEGLERLSVRQIPFKLKTIALRENMHEVHRMRDFAKSLGVSFRYDSVVNARLDRNLSPFTHGLTPKEAVELEAHDPEKKKMWQHFCSTQIGAPKDNKVYQCGAGKTTFNIDPYGRLSVCLLSRRPNYPVLEGDFLTGWRGAVQQEINRTRDVEEKCNTCSLHTLCGNCQGYADVLHGKHQAPVEDLCELAHHRLEAFDIHGECKKSVRKQIRS